MHEARRALRWFAAQPAATRQQIIEAMMEAMASTAGPIGPTADAWLIETCHALRDKEQMLSRKGLPGKEELEGLRKLRVARLQEKAKKGPKKAREIRVRFGELIGELRRQGLSWRDCAIFLKKHHRYPVSPSYLFKSLRETPQNDTRLAEKSRKRKKEGRGPAKG